MLNTKTIHVLVRKKTLYRLLHGQMKLYISLRKLNFLKSSFSFSPQSWFHKILHQTAVSWSVVTVSLVWDSGWVISNCTAGSPPSQCHTGHKGLEFIRADCLVYDQKLKYSMLTTDLILHFTCILYCRVLKGQVSLSYYNTLQVHRFVSTPREFAWKGKSQYFFRILILPSDLNQTSELELNFFKWKNSGTHTTNKQMLNTCHVN